LNEGLWKGVARFSNIRGFLKIKGRSVYMNPHKKILTVSKKRTVATIAGIYFMLMFLVPQAHALRAASAEIVSGRVEVIGVQAVRNADITWEGDIVTRADRAGTFRFSTTDLPSTCVGTLSDGVSTIQVVVRFCQPVVAATGSAYVKATGQTTSHHAGDDGALQLGAPRRYEDLGLTVLDLDTGLEWEKKCWGCVGNHGANGYDWHSGIWTWLAAVNTENGTGFAGHNDWRIPNINELQTLADYGTYAPATDAAFNNFPDNFTGQSFYWSSTSFTADPSKAWTVNFLDGSVNVYVKSEGLYVRAVRGGP
jgi:hypothetical protein